MQSSPKSSQHRFFSKLGEKYAEHAAEERGYVDKCIDRILDLGGTVKNGAKKEAPVYTDVTEWIKYDLQVSKDGLAWLKTLVEEARDDCTTFDMLKEYYQDEEEDLYWAEQQLELMGRPEGRSRNSDMPFYERCRRYSEDCSA